MFGGIHNFNIFEHNTQVKIIEKFVESTNFIPKSKPRPQPLSTLTVEQANVFSNAMRVFKERKDREEFMASIFSTKKLKQALIVAGSGVFNSSLDIFTKILINYAIIAALEYIRYRISFLDMSPTLKNTKVFKNYFSYYRYGEKSDAYPKIQYSKHTVKYTQYQLGLILNVLHGDTTLLTDAELFNLRFIKTQEEAEFYRENVGHWEYYYSYGLIIGNMSNDLEYPKKFLDILNIYKSSGEESSIVYSNYYKGGLLAFKDFLNKSNVAYTLYSPSMTETERVDTKNKFESGKIRMLLLHPFYAEGFSIKGCRHLHILEPIDNVAKFKQLETRIVRFNSHKHLPKNQRSVHIHIWVCTLRDIIEQIKLRKNDIKKWLDRYTYQFYFSFAIEKFPYSPDDFVYNRYYMATKYYKSLEKSLSDVSIEKEKNIEDTCCVWGDRDCINLKSCVEKPATKKY
jgi:hypothetical protein